MAMHITGGILTMTDKVICGAVIIVCIAIIIWNVVRFIKSKHSSRKTEV